MTGRGGGEPGGTRGTPREVRTLPTSLAAIATGVSEATIRKWVSRGKLTRYGSLGRAEYDVEELLLLASRRGDQSAPGRPDLGSD